MISKTINNFCMFLLVVILFSFVSAECSQNQFFNGVDLESGKIAYLVAGGVYYSESPCFQNKLYGDLVVTNLSISLNNSIIYYPDSSRVGLIDFFDNTSLFYFYLDDNVTLSEVYSMSGIGNYSFKTNFSYVNEKLFSVNNYFSNDLLLDNASFIFSSNNISVFGDYSYEVFNIFEDKIVNKTQFSFFGDELIEVVDYFNYSENKTIITQKYNNSLIGGLVYDFNTKNFSMECIDWDIEYGDNSTFVSAFVSSDGNFSYDMCLDETILVENYCGYVWRWDFWNMKPELKTFNQVCEYGCSLGRCLTKEEVEPDEPIEELDLPDEPPIVGEL